jgi:hypothetical protein
MEHDKDGVGALPLPRIAHYGEAMLKELVRKHGPMVRSCGNPFVNVSPYMFLQHVCFIFLLFTFNYVQE